MCREGEAGGDMCKKARQDVICAEETRKGVFGAEDESQGVRLAE